MTFWKALWCNKLSQLWSLSLVSTKAFLGAHGCEWHRKGNLIDPILFPTRMYHRKIHTHSLEKKREKRMQTVNLLHWIPISYQIKFNFLSMSFRDFHSVSLDYLSSLCSSNLLAVSPTPSKPDCSQLLWHWRFPIIWSYLLFKQRIRAVESTRLGYGVLDACFKGREAGA